MERRRLGKTEEELSIIGFGGIVVMNESKLDASRYVSKAIDRGINYFDVAPQYGNAQEMLGPALKPYRNDCFLACKTLERSRVKANNDLNRSLRLLKTDHFDLYQLHGVITIEEVEMIMGPNGAIEAFIEAKEKGIIRYIGFSAHTEESAIALMNRYDFDSILFPFNWACWLRDNFGPEVIKKAEEKKIGILALKALAKRTWGKDEDKKWPKCWYAPVDNYEEASMSLRFTLSQPVTAAIAPSYAELLWWACDIADNFKIIEEEEIKILRDKAESTNTITKDLLFS
ncbi:MAG: aldo/keto reductase [Actinobacteria bacterium]|nr:aldo/keto reductase [Actinomycetota bacterium]